MNRGLKIGSGLRLGGLGAFSIKGGGVGDTTPPTVVISSTEISPTFANPIPLIFTLSEPSTDFTIADIRVSATGTSLGNFAGSGANYTADLTITGASTTALVDVLAGAFHDAAGNANMAATQFSITSSILFKDDFTTPAPSPMISPNPSTPGPGSLAITRTTGTSIGAGEIRFAVANDVVNSNSFFARQPGRATFIKPKLLSNGYAGWFASPPTTNLRTGLRFNLGAYAVGASIDINTGTTTVAVNTPWATILRSTGSFVVQNQTLMWVDSTDSTTPLAPGMQTFAAVTGSADYMYAADMGAPWNNNMGIATSYTASPSSGTVTVSEANALIEITWQAITGTGQIWNLYTRWVDDNDCWATRLAMDTSTIKLIEINSGTATERASAAQVFTNGTKYRIVVAQDGNMIRHYIQTYGAAAVTLKNTYISGSFNNTETGIKIDHAGIDLVTWPRIISGPALTELSKFINP